MPERSSNPRSPTFPTGCFNLCTGPPPHINNTPTIQYNFLQKAERHHPPDTRRRPNVVSLLAYRLRRRPNSETTLGRRLVSGGYDPAGMMTCTRSTHRTNVGPMLGHRLRRRPNNGQHRVAVSSTQWPFLQQDIEPFPAHRKSEKSGRHNFPTKWRPYPN